MRDPLSVTASVDHSKVVATLVADQVASRLAAKDPTLWGSESESEASIRLGWVDLPVTSRPLLAEIDALRASLWADGVDRVVLCGMGGSSLAPEVITKTYRIDLTVLDSTEPSVVAQAIRSDLERTVVVVSSKSGGTLETDSQRRAFEQAFIKVGIDAASRFIVVTDSGSPLEKLAREAGYRGLFLADTSVGGRYSALTAFGLVPSGLAGVDIGDLLDEAADVMTDLAADSHGNPALILAAALAADRERDKVVIADAGSGIAGFGDWAEQLIAESTGKRGTGILPVAVEGVQAPEIAGNAPDVVAAVLSAPDEPPAVDTALPLVTASGPLGAQMLLWETATAVAGRLLGINPFDQPDVESAKAAARGLLDHRPEAEPAAFVDGAVEVRGTAGLLDGVNDLPGAVGALLATCVERSYVAVMAYLNAERDAALAGIRCALAKRTGRPTTFGWGPRFLHSTGQYHKGGPANGAYIQISCDEPDDLEIPGRPFSFGTLVNAQAAGDAKVLSEHGRPVLRLHLTDPGAGVPQLVQALS
jgi:glucose-6-phosphate isomerase